MMFALKRQTRLAAKMLREGKKLADNLRELNKVMREEYLPMRFALEEGRKTAEAVLDAEICIDKARIELLRRSK